MSISQQQPLDLPGSKAERRNLTVLFCDIVGSSALSTHFDPEDLRDILHAFQAACGEAIRRYDGHIARYMGDGVLAYFGFPAAHEDDAERAVNAALQMVETIPALTFRGAPQLKVRIGIATGLVVVGDLIGEGPSREFAVIGEAPNLAASLQQNAQPNQILVSPSARRLLAKQFEFADLGEHHVKGHDQPVQMWQVLRATAVPSRFEARQSSRLTPFFGRDHELSVLERLFENARHGHGQTVTICGEAGIGKSRLVTAFRNSLGDEKFRTLLFQCSSYHTNSPWYPVIRHLEDATGITYDASPSLKLEKIEALVDHYLPSQRDTAVPLIAALMSVPAGTKYPALELTPQQQKKKTFEVMRDVVQAQSERHPLILVCEDVHWSDPTSAELLDQFRQYVSDLNILLIVSFRPEHAVAWTNISKVTPLTLNRLENSHVASMISSLTEGALLSNSVVEQIANKTDGVPLFIEEVTKAVLEAKTSPELPAATGIPVTPTVPDTLHDSLMSRLDQAAPMKFVAQISSAIGREFTLELLESVAPMPKREVRAAIESLLDSGLLFRRTQTSTEAYIFKHALVQDVAYASMLRDERRQLHIRIADALTTKFLDISEIAPELVAHHYTQAGAKRQAAEHWLKAGRQASKRSAFVEATAHFNIALDQLTDLPETAERDDLELQLQQSLASAFIAVKGFGAAETTRAFSRALELCEKHAGSPQVFAVLNGMVGIHLMRGEFEQSRMVAQDLLSRAQHSKDSTALMMGHRVLGMSLFVIGELRDAKLELENAIELYDADRHASLALVFSQDFKATAQAYLGLTLVLMGEIEAGLNYGRSAVAYAEQLRHPHSVCYVLPFLAGAYLVAGLPKEGHAVAERTILLSAEYGFPQWFAGGLMLRGWARGESGDVEAGLADIRASIGALEQTGTLIWMQFARFLLAKALAKAGQFGDAMEIIENITAEISATSGRWYEAEVLRLRGDLLAGVGGSLNEAEKSYEAAIAVAIRQGARLWQLRATNSLAALLRGRGREAELRARLAPLCAEFDGHFTNVDLQQGRMLLAAAPPMGAV
jgi:class 3 adenylate cyclase/predicted ATPase